MRRLRCTVLGNTYEQCRRGSCARLRCLSLAQAALNRYLASCQNTDTEPSREESSMKLFTEAPTFGVLFTKTSLDNYLRFLERPLAVCLQTRRQPPFDYYGAVKVKVSIFTMMKKSSPPPALSKNPR